LAVHTGEGVILKAAAGITGPAQGTVDDRLGTTDTGIYPDGLLWTVVCASTAFHARIAIHYSG
jgi:hypothetical protein